jgi:hypothetical protein
MNTELLTESLAIAADGIHSASQAASEHLTGAVDLAVFPQVLFIIDSGTLGASGTLDFQVKASSTAGGTYTAVPGTAIDQLVVASNNNQYALVLVTAEKINALGLGYRFVKGSLVPGTAAANSAVVVIGALNRFEPTASQDASTVVQTLALWR